MKITKAELIERRVCKNGLKRFVKQTNNTREPVEVVSLIGGENTLLDFMWLACEMLPKERIVQFACDCALINIEVIKPYTDDYDLVVEFLRNPATRTHTAAGDVHARAVHAARVAYATDAAYAVANAAYANTDCDVDEAATAAAYAAESAGDEEKVNELLRELFS